MGLYSIQNHIMSQFIDGNAEEDRKVPRLSHVPVWTKITLITSDIDGKPDGSVSGILVSVYI